MKAYILLHEKFHRSMSPNEFKKALGEAFFEENEGIEKLAFDYYLPIPGQKAIQLIYKVSYKSGERRNLHIVLLGDAEKGYKIAYMNLTSKEPELPDVKIYGMKKLRIKDEIIIKPDTIIIKPISSFNEG